MRQRSYPRFGWGLWNRDPWKARARAPRLPQEMRPHHHQALWSQRSESRISSPGSCSNFLRRNYPTVYRSQGLPYTTTYRWAQGWEWFLARGSRSPRRARPRQSRRLGGSAQRSYAWRWWSAAQANCVLEPKWLTLRNINSLRILEDTSIMTNPTSRVRRNLFFWNTVDNRYDNSAKNDGSCRPTQPSKTKSMNQTNAAHQKKMGTFSRRVSLKLNSSGV